MVKMIRLDRPLVYAVALAGALNIFLLASPFFDTTYDAESHLFFADHYLRDWFDPWEERWFGGFSVFSYPPLIHQFTAALGKFLGLEVGYRVAQGPGLRQSV